MIKKSSYLTLSWPLTSNILRSVLQAYLEKLLLISGTFLKNLNEIIEITTFFLETYYLVRSFASKT